MSEITDVNFKPDAEPEVNELSTPTVAATQRRRRG
jgi:hypothetical protein